MTIILGIAAAWTIGSLLAALALSRAIRIADDMMWDGSCPDTVPEWVQA